MSERIEMAAKLAEQYSYEHLRQLTELTLNAMSYHLLVENERIGLSDQSTQSAVQQLLHKCRDVTAITKAVQMVRLKADLKSTPAEIAAVRTILEASADPQVMALNRVLYTQ